MKKFKNAKVTDIHWTLWNGGGYYVRYESKKKVNWKGFPKDTSMKINDCDYMLLDFPFGTPYSIVLKKAYEILNNI